MISIADTLSLDRIRLQLDAADGTAAILETANLLRNVPAVLDWPSLYAGMLKAAPCLSEQGSDFAICLPHARTEAVSGMVMSIGRSLNGIAFSASPSRVRYLFCIGVPQALAQDYFRIVGLLMRILRSVTMEEPLRRAKTPKDFLNHLSALEAKL
jgi:PTS system nitrogen regulatory IIA component